MYVTPIGSEWKKLQKNKGIMRKDALESIDTRTFTLANAIFAS